MFRPSLAHFRSRFAAALLVACAGCQQVPLAPIDAAANRDRIAARSLTATAVDDALARHSLPVTQRAWSLDQLTLAAWTLRTDVGVARAEVGAARAKTGVEAQRPNPTVQTTNEKVISGGPDPWVLGAALAMTFELGGKRDIRRETALAGERAAEWAFGEALWSARAEVRSALLDVSFANASVALDGDEARLAREYLDWVDTAAAIRRRDHLRAPCGRAGVEREHEPPRSSTPLTSRARPRSSRPRSA